MTEQQTETEAASDIETTKPKRGRPRVLDISYLKAIYPDIHTDRQRQNRLYAFHALNALGLSPQRGVPTPAPTWLVDWDGANRGKQGAVKWAVLEQLGRMIRDGWGEENVRDFAAQIGENRLSAKEAARRLRYIRLMPPEE